MDKGHLITATFLSITACATSGLEEPEPATNTEYSATNADMTAVEDQLEVVDIPEVPVSANVPPSKNEIVCRKERRTGTYLAKRVCRTRAQMEAEREAGQDTLDTLSRRTLSGPDSGSTNK